MRGTSLVIVEIIFYHEISLSRWVKTVDGRVVELGFIPWDRRFLQGENSINFHCSGYHLGKNDIKSFGSLVHGNPITQVQGILLAEIRTCP